MQESPRLVGPRSGPAAFRRIGVAALVLAMGASIDAGGQNALDPPSLDEIIAASRHENPNVRLHAFDALADILEPNEKTLRALLPGFRDSALGAELCRRIQDRLRGYPAETVLMIANEFEREGGLGSPNETRTTVSLLVWLDPTRSEAGLLLPVVPFLEQVLAECRTHSRPAHSAARIFRLLEATETPLEGTVAPLEACLRSATDRRDRFALAQMLGTAAGAEYEPARSTRERFLRSQRLHELALEGGSLDEVRSLLQGDVDASSRSMKSAPEYSTACLWGTPLTAAVRNRNLPLVELLLEHGVDVEVSDDDHSPILLAVERGDLEIVNALLAHGARPNELSSRGENRLLAAAVRLGHDRIAAALRDAGASGAPDRMRARDALLVAACRGNEPAGDRGRMVPSPYEAAGAPVVDLGVLLERGADPNSTDTRGYTALMYAARLGLLENVRLLVAYGADPSRLQGDGGVRSMTALDMARVNRHEAVITFLGTRTTEQAETSDVRYHLDRRSAHRYFPLYRLEYRGVDPRFRTHRRRIEFQDRSGRTLHIVEDPKSFEVRELVEHRARANFEGPSPTGVYPPITGRFEVLRGDGSVEFRKTFPGPKTGD